MFRGISRIAKLVGVHGSAPCPVATSPVVRLPSLSLARPGQGCRLHCASLTPFSVADAEEIPSGNLNVDVQFMGTPIFNTQWDLCGKTTCPITPGELDIEYSQTLPPVAPPVRAFAPSCGRVTMQTRTVTFPLLFLRASSVGTPAGIHTVTVPTSPFGFLCAFLATCAQRVFSVGHKSPRDRACFCRTRGASLMGLHATHDQLLDKHIPCSEAQHACRVRMKFGSRQFLMMGTLSSA